MKKIVYLIPLFLLSSACVERASLGTAEKAALVDLKNRTSVEKATVFDLKNRTTRQSVQDNQCNAPKPSKKDLLVSFGSYEAQAISTVTVAGQDKETTTGKIIIQEGNQPIYLILSSYSPIIWQIEGDIDRISKLVVGGSRSESGLAQAGVTGLPESKIFFDSKGKCVKHYYNYEDAEGTMAKILIKKSFDKEPDLFVGNYGFSEVQLPEFNPKGEGSEMMRKPVPEGFDHMTWIYVTHFYNGGVVSLEKQKVISENKVEDYEVLPSQAGISQLVYQKKLKVVNSGFPGEYKIIKEIPRFPAELTGSHSATFILGKGIKMPEGDIGHSCLINEETGEVKGAACHSF